MKRSMQRPSIRITFRVLCAAAALSLALLMSSQALAGGFQLSIETPGSNRELKDVVLIARTYGCHQPADAKLAATAEGLVNGVRKSVSVELRSIGSGVYAISRQWPADGTWVLVLTGAYNGMTSSVLVQLGPNGSVLPGTRLEEGKLDGVNAKAARRKWVATDIDAALKAPRSVTSQTSEDLERLMLSPLSALTWTVGALGAGVITFGWVKRSRRGSSGERS